MLVRKTGRCPISQKKIDRRDFLKASALAAAGGALRPVLAPAAAARPALVEVSGPGVPRALDEAVRKLLEPLGGMSAFIKPGQKVLIKPNMGFPTPAEQRATTSPALLAALVRQVLTCQPAQVLVADNPVRRPEACLRINGIREALASLPVKLVMPTAAAMFKRVAVPQGKSLRRVEVFSYALEADVHISVPVAKSHNAAGYSGSLKGSMGMVLDRESFHSRYDLNQAIADLGTILRPQLTVLDGLQVMTTDGPAGPGELVTTNTLVAGRDQVAVDARGVELAPLYGRRIRARQVKHLRLASEQGLGRLQLPAGQVKHITM